MAMTTKQRTDLREELVSQGYHWEYIDEWQPKVSLYRHRAVLSQSGEVVSDVGTKLANLPGSPDYVNKKARIGLLPWPPSEACTCKWCVERRGSGNMVVAQPVEEGPPPVSYESSSRRGSKRFGPHLESS